MSDIYKRDGSALVPRNDLALDPGYRSNFQTVLEGRLDVIESLALSTFVPNTVGKLVTVTAGVVEYGEGEIAPLWTYKASLYAVPGRTVSASLIASLMTNAVGPASKIEPTVFTVSSSEGAEKKTKFAVTAVTGSAVAIEPVASTTAILEGSPFVLVDGTTYTLGLVNPKITALKSRTIAALSLVLRYV